MKQHMAYFQFANHTQKSPAIAATLLAVLQAVLPAARIFFLNMILHL